MKEIHSQKCRFSVDTVEIDPLFEGLGKMSVLDLIKLALWVALLGSSELSNTLFELLRSLLDTVPDGFVAYCAMKAPSQQTRDICLRSIEAFDQNRQLVIVGSLLRHRIMLGCTQKEINDFTLKQFKFKGTTLFNIHDSDNLGWVTDIGLLKVPTKPSGSEWKGLQDFHKHSLAMLEVVDLFLKSHRSTFVVNKLMFIPPVFLLASIAPYVQEHLFESNSLDVLFHHYRGSLYWLKSYADQTEVVSSLIEARSIPGEPQEFLHELAIQKYCVQKGLQLSHFQNRTLDTIFDNELAEWLPLKQILVVHEIRKQLATPRIVLVGLTTIGKSTALSKVFGVRSSFGILDKDRTHVPKLHRIANNAFDVVDCPGANDAKEQVKEIAETVLNLPGVCMVFLRCGAAHEESAARIVQQLRKAVPSRPMIICLNRVDEWFCQIESDSNWKELQMDQKRKIIETEWKKMEENLADSLKIEGESKIEGHYIIPTIINTDSEYTKNRLEQMREVFRFCGGPNTKLHLARDIRQLLFEVLQKNRWMSAEQAKSWNHWKEDIDKPPSSCLDTK